MRTKFYLALVFLLFAAYGCGDLNSAKTEELGRWDDLVEIASDDGKTIDARKVDEKTLKVAIQGYENTVGMAFSVVAIKLELPEIIVTKIAATRPIDPPAEDKYRNVTITWDVDRKSGGQYMPDEVTITLFLELD